MGALISCYVKRRFGLRPSKLRVAGSSLVCRSNLTPYNSKRFASKASPHSLLTLAWNIPILTHAVPEVCGKKVGIKKQPQTGFVIGRAVWNERVLADHCSADQFKNQMKVCRRSYRTPGCVRATALALADSLPESVPRSMGFELAIFGNA